MKSKIRKIATFVEETQREMNREISPPTRKAAAVAVIENPCAGKYVEDLSELMAIGDSIYNGTRSLTTNAELAQLSVPAQVARAFGCEVLIRRPSAIRRERAGGTPVAQQYGGGSITKSA